ncbi:ubiquitin carboxyl-terminal hydrolase 43 isoform X1 [Numida meleagris]|uniref:ubiquitin carboxyl-terminal hydrolase 43 isoform X1 n=1 Tax=Numida meleagris TaxID=8996 RepID=UPI000B3DC60F|nr:ubiquitin carboxyl-terminal hydrolase 43 isoform X1 [Numida meleagris]
MHEDLGSASPAPGPRAAQQRGAEQSGAGGESFVQSHFQAQYRSSLTCPHCRKQSNTFDPFLCISLPIPVRQTRALNVTLVLQREGGRSLRVGLAVPLLGTAAELREMVAREGDVPPQQVILAEVSPQGSLRSLDDSEELSTAGQGAPLYALQAPPDPPAGARPVLLLLLCHVAGTGPHRARFGPLLVLRAERGASWAQLQRDVLAPLRAVMRGAVQGTAPLFRIHVAGEPGAYLSPQDVHPLSHAAIDRALQQSPAGGPPHVALTVEWDVGTKERLFGSVQQEAVRDADSVRLQQAAHQQHSCTLDECFQLYTKEEQLAPDDAWRCPHCRVPQQGTVQLRLWTLPDILIIHLKRFRQVAQRRHKLSTLVCFPLRGLDMAPHLAPGGGRWQHPLRPPRGCPPDALYDLYAVCNHHGSMQGGHYTAYCCNSLDGRWYSYDDSTVEEVREDEVSTRSAYILFYQRRNAIPAWSASSAARAPAPRRQQQLGLIEPLGGPAGGPQAAQRRIPACSPAAVPTLQPGPRHRTGARRLRGPALCAGCAEPQSQCQAAPTRPLQGPPQGRAPALVLHLPPTGGPRAAAAVHPGGAGRWEQPPCAPCGAELPAGGCGGQHAEHGAPALQPGTAPGPQRRPRWDPVPQKPPREWGAGDGTPPGAAGGPPSGTARPPQPRRAHPALTELGLPPPAAPPPHAALSIAGPGCGGHCGDTGPGARGHSAAWGCARVQLLRRGRGSCGAELAAGDTRSIVQWGPWGQGIPAPWASRTWVPRAWSILQLHVWLQEHPAPRTSCSGVSAVRASLRWEHRAPGYPALGASCHGLCAVRASLHHQHPGVGCTVRGVSTTGSIELWAVWKQGIPAPGASCIRVSITTCTGSVMHWGAQTQGMPAP